MNGNYPAGAANDPNAPYNEICCEEKDFEADVMCTLYGKGKFASDEYEGDYYDEEGYIPAEYNGEKSKAKLVQEQMYTPKQLLQEYAAFLLFALPNTPSEKGKNEIKKKIESCLMWTEEEYEEQ